VANAQESETVWRPVIGVAIGAPYVVSLYGGAGLMRHRVGDGEQYRGVAGVAEIGRGGGQFTIAATSEAEALMKRLQAGVVRTWGKPWMAAPDQTFVSIQAQASFVLGVNVGLYERVQGHEPGETWFAAARFILGF
jgi:hypothetical protein